MKLQRKGGRNIISKAFSRLFQSVKQCVSKCETKCFEARNKVFLSSKQIENTLFSERKRVLLGTKKGTPPSPEPLLTLNLIL